LKSSAFDELQENEILVTSDTIVWHNDKALGKPNDKQDAFTILKSLSNTTHELLRPFALKLF
jgi:septum formation protein